MQVTAAMLSSSKCLTATARSMLCTLPAQQMSASLQHRLPPVRPYTARLSQPRPLWCADYGEGAKFVHQLPELNRVICSWPSGGAAAWDTRCTSALTGRSLALLPASSHVPLSRDARHG